MTGLLEGSDLLGASVVLLGYIGAIVAYWFSHKEDRESQRESEKRDRDALEHSQKKEAYDAFFVASERYNALLRTWAYKNELDITDSYAEYEANKSKVALFGSKEVLRACGEYSKSMVLYRHACRNLSANQNADENEQVMQKLVTQKNERWEAMKESRLKALSTAMKEMNLAIDPDDSEIVETLYFYNNKKNDENG